MIRFLVSCPLVFLLVLLTGVYYYAAAEQPLNGKHLSAIPINIFLPPYLTMTRNSSTGEFIRVSGVMPTVFDWLSQSLNFTYTILQDDMRAVDANSASKGATSFLLEEKADLILAPIIITSARFAKMDFTHIFNTDQLAIMMPMPSFSANLRAIWDPLQPSIWIFHLASVAVIVAVLFGVNSWMMRAMKGNNRFNLWIMRDARDMRRMAEYLLSLVLAQGGSCFSHRLFVRLIIGALCLSCLVLYQAYNSVLVSLITLPMYHPLLKSVYDIPKMSGIKVAVEKFKAGDIIFQAAETGIGKYLGDMMRKDPSLRCSTERECLDIVRLHKSRIFIMDSKSMLDLIGRDYEKTRRCDFTMATEKFADFKASFGGIQKGSPYTRQLTLELYRIESVGLFNLWRGKRIASVATQRCVDYAKEILQKPVEPRLNLSHLSGAFAILIVGLSFSLFMFLGELIYRRFVPPSNY